MAGRSQLIRFVDTRPGSIGDKQRPPGFVGRLSLCWFGSYSPLPKRRDHQPARGAVRGARRRLAVGERGGRPARRAAVADGRRRPRARSRSSPFRARSSAAARRRARPLARFLPLRRGRAHDRLGRPQAAGCISRRRGTGSGHRPASDGAARTPPSKSATALRHFRSRRRSEFVRDRSGQTVLQSATPAASAATAAAARAPLAIGG